MIELIADFLAGAVFVNSIPHLAAGLRGELFPTPFAKPPGVGKSHPAVNFTWGLANVLVGAILIAFAPIAVGINAGFILFIVGALIVGIFTASYFYRWRQHND